MGNFKEDLLEWKQIEEKFGAKLAESNPWCTVNFTEWYNKDYDIELIKQDWTRITFEIKYDRMADKTGNVAIETSYAWQPSWFVTSKANYLVYYVKWWFRYAKTTEIYPKVIEYEKVFWWDWNKSELILIRRQDFISIFEKY